MENINSENYMNVALSVLGELGLAIDHNNEIYDQDTFNKIMVAGKSLIFSRQIMQYGIFCGPNQIIFEPFTNRKMMMQLFALYLRKCEQENGIKYVTWTVLEDADGSGKTSICTVDSRNEKVVSRSYLNPCLAFCDYILQSGYPYQYMNGEYNLEELEPLWEMSKQ